MYGAVLVVILSLGVTINLVLTSYKASRALDVVAHPVPNPVKVTYRDLPAIPAPVNTTDLHTKKQIECLASNIYFEARSEPLSGQVAVALVTLNRAASDMFPNTICAVVKQQRADVCQFSWWCDNVHRAQAMRKAFPEKHVYKQIVELATTIYSSYPTLDDHTRGALFYHATYVPKQKLGVSGLQRTTKIGRHVFYKVKS